MKKRTPEDYYRLWEYYSRPDVMERERREVEEYRKLQRKVKTPAKKTGETDGRP